MIYCIFSKIELNFNIFPEEILFDLFVARKMSVGAINVEVTPRHVPQGSIRQVLFCASIQSFFSPVFSLTFSVFSPSLFSSLSPLLPSLFPPFRTLPTIMQHTAIMCMMK